MQIVIIRSYNHQLKHIQMREILKEMQIYTQILWKVDIRKQLLLTRPSCYKFLQYFLLLLLLQFYQFSTTIPVKVFIFFHLHPHNYQTHDPIINQKSYFLQMFVPLSFHYHLSRARRCQPNFNFTQYIINQFIENMSMQHKHHNKLMHQHLHYNN